MPGFLSIPCLLLLPFIGFSQSVFQDLTAIQFGDSILINWKLTGGNTCFDMHLERADDKTDFTPIYSIGGVCGSSEDQYYNYIDAEGLRSGTTYYYLVTASSGIFKSDTVQITYIDAGDRAIFIYPNPASLVMTVTIDNSFIPAFLVECSTVEGKLVSRTIQNQNVFTLDASNIHAGNYILKITTTDGAVLTAAISILN